jgi:uncharacterized membrane protein
MRALHQAQRSLEQQGLLKIADAAVVTNGHDGKLHVANEAGRYQDRHAGAGQTALRR